MSGGLLKDKYAQQNRARYASHDAWSMMHRHKRALLEDTRPENLEEHPTAAYIVTRVNNKNEPGQQFH